MDGSAKWLCLLLFIIWKLEWMNLQERSCYLTEYSCFDYFLQVLFGNITVWILLRILTFSSVLSISVNTILKSYDSQGLNLKLKLVGAMKYFSKTLLGHEIFSSVVLWVVKLSGAP